MTYQETLSRIQVLRVMADSGTGNRRDVLSELARLKRNICKFPEHKAKKGQNRDNTNEYSD